METIKLTEARELYLSDSGLPPAEMLMTIDQVCDELGKPISNDRYERQYQLNLARTVMSALKRDFGKHHILFVAPKIGGKVHYGFTNDPELIENYISRIHKLALTYRRLESQVKQISSGQLDLIPFDNN